MKEKIKKILKNRIFLCTSTALIFGTIGVSAATYFPSNNVTYDNTQSGLSSTDVQGAIDELYNEVDNACKPSITLGEQIINKANVVTSGDGLYRDNYEYGKVKYFYKGVNPKNYITFNNEKAGWRIMSIEDNGTIKITSVDTKMGISWGTTSWANSHVCEYYNVNFYNQLSSSAQSQISTGTFNIGSITENNDNLTLQMTNERSAQWSGKIALPTLSEYLRANSDMTSCETYHDINYYSFCNNTTWMDHSNNWYTLSTISGKDTIAMIRYGEVFQISNGTTSYQTRPALYLKARLTLTGGDGSQSNPYTIQ